MTSTSALLIVLIGCAPDPQVGAERSACRAVGVCDPGLTCLSDRCVRYVDPSAPPPVVGGTPGLPASCTEYVAVLDKWASCATLPAESRASLRRVIAQMKQSWAQLGSAQMPQAVDDACKQGVAAIKQGMSNFHCP